MDFLTRAFLTRALLRAFRVVLLLAVLVLSIVCTFLPLPRFDLALLSITQNSTGPTVYIGLLGSCTRYDPSALTICTGPTIPPQFDTSVLSALSTKTQAHVQAHLAIKFGAPNFGTAVAVSIGHILLLISTPLIVAQAEVPSSRRWPWIHPIALLGIPGVGLPLAITVHLQLMFDVAIKIFNASQGQFVLRTGKLWILMMVCYGLLAAAFVTTVASRFWPTDDPNDTERTPSERPSTSSRASPSESGLWAGFRMNFEIPRLPFPQTPPPRIASILLGSVLSLGLSNSSVNRQPEQSRDDHHQPAQQRGSSEEPNTSRPALGTTIANHPNDEGLPTLPWVFTPNSRMNKSPRITMIERPMDIHDDS